jgi:hypothetical protein
LDIGTPECLERLGLAVATAGEDGEAQSNRKSTKEPLRIRASPGSAKSHGNYDRDAVIFSSGAIDSAG